MEFHFFVILDLQILIDLCRSQRQFQNPKHLGVEEMTPVDDPALRLPATSRLFWGLEWYNVSPPSYVCCWTKAPVTVVINAINHSEIGVLNYLVANYPRIVSGL